jgi:hypothetical protein
MTAVVTIFRFVKEKEWKVLAPKQVAAALKSFLFTIAPISALLLAGHLGDMQLSGAAPYFAGAALISCILGQMGLSAELRSFLLLASAVGLTMVLPRGESVTENASLLAQPLLGTMGGLLVWKLTENLLRKPESRLDDITAPLIWLTTIYWSNFVSSRTSALISQEIVLATLLVSVFIRWVQPTLLPNDNIYLKRIMLSLTGGLALLILSTKVLTNVEQGPIVGLAGAGFLTTYLLQSLDRSVDDGPSLARGLKNILLVGICTLAATRLFGMQGLLVLAATTVIAPLPGSALIAGLFWVSRVLIETFISQYVPNVTGMNLMHSYSSAALYAGFLFIVVATLFTKDMKDRRLLMTILLGSMIVAPAGISYFLHGEPTGTFLVSMGVGAVLLSYLAAAFFPGHAADQENLILLPAIGAVTALTSQELLQLGNDASSHDRIIAMCWIGGVVAVLAVAGRLLVSTGKGKPQQPSADPV